MPLRVDGDIQHTRLETFTACLYLVWSDEVLKTTSITSLARASREKGLRGSMPVLPQSHVPVSADGDTASMLCLPVGIHHCIHEVRDARLSFGGNCYCYLIMRAVADRPTLDILGQPGGASA
jgi:hypothetical protein